MRSTSFLLPDELAKFLSVERPLRESVARDILIDTGLRVSEVCRANVGDVLQVDERVVLAVTVKGRGRRYRKLHVPLSAAVAAEVFEWLVSRGIHAPQDPKQRDLPLLTNREGQRWQRTGLSALMGRIGVEAGIDRFRVSAHKLRHTSNVVARMAGIDPLVRSRLLGHSSPASLSRYEHLLPGELHQARDAHASALLRYTGRNPDA